MLIIFGVCSFYILIVKTENCLKIYFCDEKFFFAILNWLDVVYLNNFAKNWNINKPYLQDNLI